MKNAILKAVVLATMVLSLVLAGIAVIDTADTGVAVCHDGPQRDALFY